MLIELSIRDFAIIDELRVAFEPGLNALTGETGAGKSIIVDALGAVLGERVGSEVVRTGAKAALVEAHVDISNLTSDTAFVAMLTELGVEPDDDMLILGREIHANGRSVARINGRATTATILGRVGSRLVDVHGQSEHLSLLHPASHLELLDRYAGLQTQRDEVSAVVREIRGVRSRIDDVTAGSREREQRSDLLRFQIAEIEETALDSGEDATLAAERTRLLNASRLAAAAMAGQAHLVGGDDDAAAALPCLRVALLQVNDIAGLDEAMEVTAARMQETVYVLEELGSELRSYADGIQFDPARLDAVDERLDLIRTLKRKYGASIDDVLAYADAAVVELASLTGGEGNLEILMARERGLLDHLGSLVGALSAGRREAATRLESGIEQSMAELGMGSASFSVQFDNRPDPNGVIVPGVGEEPVAFNDRGVDRVEYLLAANAGEELKPLGRVASGGETARLMLALKSILAAADTIPCLVFDEVDVGVGARSGQVVGEKLHSLSHEHQVIVITHLAQIAAFAEAHFRIAKSDQSGRTVSSVVEVRGDERLDEIAAMLDGLPVTDVARASAAHLMERVDAWRGRAAIV